MIVGAPINRAALPADTRALVVSQLARAIAEAYRRNHLHIEIEVRDEAPAAVNTDQPNAGLGACRPVVPRAAGGRSHHEGEQLEGATTALKTPSSQA